MGRAYRDLTCTAAVFLIVINAILYVADDPLDLFTHFVISCFMLHNYEPPLRFVYDYFAAQSPFYTYEKEKICQFTQ